jgi:hypothetical protein
MTPADIKEVFELMQKLAMKLPPDQQSWVEGPHMIACSFVNGKFEWRAITHPSGRYPIALTPEKALDSLTKIATPSALARLRRQVGE